MKQEIDIPELNRIARLGAINAKLLEVCKEIIKFDPAIEDCLYLKLKQAIEKAGG